MIHQSLHPITSSCGLNHKFCCRSQPDVQLHLAASTSTISRAVTCHRSPLLRSNRAASLRWYTSKACVEPKPKRWGLSTCLSTDPSIHPSVLPSIVLFIFLLLSVYLSILFSICLSVCLSVCLSIYLSTYLPTYLPIYLSHYIALHYITLHYIIYIYGCVCVCLSLCRHLQGSRQRLKASQGPTYIFFGKYVHMHIRSYIYIDTYLYMYVYVYAHGMLSEKSRADRKPPWFILVARLYRPISLIEGREVVPGVGPWQQWLLNWSELRT